MWCISGNYLQTRNGLFLVCVKCFPWRMLQAHLLFRAAHNGVILRRCTACRGCRCRCNIDVERLRTQIVQVRVRERRLRGCIAHFEKRKRKQRNFVIYFNYFFYIYTLLRAGIVISILTAYLAVIWVVDWRKFAFSFLALVIWFKISLLVFCDWCLDSLTVSLADICVIHFVMT